MAPRGTPSASSEYRTCVRPGARPGPELPLPPDPFGRRSAQYARAGERHGRMTLGLELLALAGLILLNGFFVAAEYGLVTSRRTRILELEHQGDRRARA